MYSVENKYLYEILDDFQCASSDEEKNDIFNNFCKHLWKVNNERNTYVKNISFTVSENCNKDYAQIFNRYTAIPYRAYKSKTSEANAWSLLRQKINNIYTNMCDKSVCTKSEYLALLHVPKRMYYRYVNNNLNMTANELEANIKYSLEKSKSLFDKYSRQKMNVTWKQYKELINRWLYRIFHNYICIDSFEDKSNITIDIDYWTEDNYVVKYICKSLNGYMRNYQKDYYGISKKRKQKLSRCECGNLFERHNNKHKYCSSCAKQRIKEYDRKRKKNTFP